MSDWKESSTVGTVSGRKDCLGTPTPRPDEMKHEPVERRERFAIQRAGNEMRAVDFASLTYPSDFAKHAGHVPQRACLRNPDLETCCGRTVEKLKKYWSETDSTHRRLHSLGYGTFRHTLRHAWVRAPTLGRRWREHQTVDMYSRTCASHGTTLLMWRSYPRKRSGTPAMRFRISPPNLSHLPGVTVQGHHRPHRMIKPHVSLLLRPQANRKLSR